MSNDNVVDIKDAKKKKKNPIFFSTTKTEPELTLDEHELAYKSCFTCLHYQEYVRGVGRCGHFPSANFHEVTTGACFHNSGKVLWYPKSESKSFWKRFKEKWFK